jgi:hypothetical protein
MPCTGQYLLVAPCDYRQVAATNIVIHTCMNHTKKTYTNRLYNEIDYGARHTVLYSSPATWGNEG